MYPLALLASGPSPEDALVATETAELVGTAVLRLPTQQRTVVVLRIWGDLSYAEIAETVGCTEATVRSHMHHGLTALHHYLKLSIALRVCRESSVAALF